MADFPLFMREVGRFCVGFKSFTRCQEESSASTLDAGFFRIYGLFLLEVRTFAALYVSASAQALQCFALKIAQILLKNIALPAVCLEGFFVVLQLHAGALPGTFMSSASCKQVASKLRVRLRVSLQSIRRFLTPDHLPADQEPRASRRRTRRAGRRSDRCLTGQCGYRCRARCARWPSRRSP